MFPPLFSGWNAQFKSFHSFRSSRWIEQIRASFPRLTECGDKGTVPAIPGAGSSIPCPLAESQRGPDTLLSEFFTPDPASAGKSHADRDNHAYSIV